MTLKVGMIGCGNVVSYGHKPALTTLADVELWRWRILPRHAAKSGRSGSA